MAAASSVKLGIKAVLYRNTAVSTPYASPTWTAMPIVKDVQAGTPWDMADASTRGSRAKIYHPTQIDYSFSAVARCDDADAGYQALLAAAQEGSTIEMLVMDGPTSVEGSQGVRAHFHVSLTGQPQGIGDVLYANFDFKPGFGTDDSGAIVYPKYAVAGASSAITYSVAG